MANTIKVKMKCVGLTPPVPGQEQQVALDEIYTSDTAQHNAQILNEGPTG